MSPSRRRAALVLVGASLTWSCTAAFAASQLFKCVEGGRTVYQQQACSPSSQPEPPPGTATKASAPTSMAKASAPAGQATLVSQGKVKMPPSPASSALATPR
jgi:hypothetical protein